MATRTVKLQPYFMENPEDDRIPDAVAGYAAHLDPQFVLDMTAVDHQEDDSNRHVTWRRSKIGKEKGINISLREMTQPKDPAKEGTGIEVSTFGLLDGRRALIRYEMRWDKGNRSYLELEVDGPDKEADDIVAAFHKSFDGPTDHDIEDIKKQMNESLRAQQWGATQDSAQALLLWRPDDTDALLAIGSALILSRDYDQAEKVMHRLLELQPDSYPAHLNLGNVWMDRQNYDKAIEEYRAMMKAAPDQSFGPFILATAYEAKGDKQQALEYYKQAASMRKSPGPTDFPELAREAIERLSS